MTEERRQLVWNMGVLSKRALKRGNQMRLRNIIFGKKKVDFEDEPTKVIKKEETRVVQYEEVPQHLKGKKKTRPAWQWMEAASASDWENDPTIPCGLVCKHTGEWVNKDQIVEEREIVTNKLVVDELDVETGISLYYDE